VYILVGGLPLQVAFSAGRSAEGSEGALVMLLRQPRGAWLLGVVAAGLIGYGVFGLAREMYRRLTPS
jgi:hypothetical protein